MSLTRVGRTGGGRQGGELSPSWQLRSTAGLWGGHSPPGGLLSPRWVFIPMATAGEIVEILQEENATMLCWAKGPGLSLFLKWHGAELQARVCQAASPCRLYLTEFFLVSFILENMVHFDDNTFSLPFFL